MGRIYGVTFLNVAVAAAQDVVSVKGSVGKLVRLRRAWLMMNDTTLQTAQGLRINLKFGSATVTQGTGGTTPTPQPFDPGDAAASFTAHCNDTAQATTSGAFGYLVGAGGHNYGNFERVWGPGEGPLCGNNQALILELLSTPSGTCHFSGGMDVEEFGG